MVGAGSRPARHGGDALDRARRAEQVPDHRLVEETASRSAWSPKARRMALVSETSRPGRGAVGVDVADRLGGSSAERSARRMARAAPLPSSDGAVTWKASADCPRRPARRGSGPAVAGCCPLLQDHGPGASPITKPLRRASNGREASGAVVELGGQGGHLREGDQRDLHEGRLEPPATIAVASPCRMAWKARPMAWLEAAQAVVVQKLGPQAELHGDLAGGGVGHQLGHGERGDPVGALRASPRRWPAAS